MTQSASHIILCPGQGAQAVGMGKAWHEKSAAARAVFDEADRVLGSAPHLGAPLSTICFEGPAERVNQTDVSQPAIYTCSVASWRGMRERCQESGVRCQGEHILAAAGLSLGEYTALHLADVFDFETGLRLVAERGRLMQEAAVASKGGMVALIGADEAEAQAVCDKVVATLTPALSQGERGVLVCANFNAPGQIVLSGSADACEQALGVAGEMGFKATPLTVAGAFHSPLMQPAAEKMAAVLASATFRPPRCEVWSNVTGRPHPTAGIGDQGLGIRDQGRLSPNPSSLRPALELLKRRLVEQIISPVKWSQTCAALPLTGPDGSEIEYHELAPGNVLRGLMRRIDRNRKVVNHDQPQD